MLLSLYVVVLVVVGGGGGVHDLVRRKQKAFGEMMKGGYLREFGWIYGDGNHVVIFYPLNAELKRASAKHLCSNQNDRN